MTTATFGDTSTFVSRPYWGDGKSRMQAVFDFPEDIARNQNGGFVIADTWNNAIRRIRPDGIVKTIAGTGSYGDTTGGAKQSMLALPRGVDVANGVVYIADTDNDKIKTIRNGVLTTLVEGLDAPEDVLVFGNTLYILNTGANALQRVSTEGGSVTTITSTLSIPKKMTVTSDGKFAYIANSGTYQVVRVNLSSGEKTIIAGIGNLGYVDGACDEAKFQNVWGVHLIDDATLYVSDGDGFSDYVRKIDLTTCTVTTFASDAAMVSINYPTGLVSDDDTLFVVATGIGIVQAYQLADAADNELFAGASRFNVRERNPILVGDPKSLVLSSNKKTIYFSENNRIRAMRRHNPKNARTIAGSVVDSYPDDESQAQTTEESRFSDVTSLTLSKDGKLLYVTDRNNNRIREVSLATGETTYLTGSGMVNMSGSDENGFADGEACKNTFTKNVSGCAMLNRPTASVLSKDGKFLYVTDASNNTIRRVTVLGVKKGNVTTIAGSTEEGFVDGIGTDARFYAPIGITRSADGKTLYVVDRNNHAIRAIDIATRQVITLVGNGTAGYREGTFTNARLSSPTFITRSADGNFYFSEIASSNIRMLDMKNNVTKLVSGSTTRGYKNGSRKIAMWDNPTGLLATKRKLFVAELNNDVIRVVDIAGEAPYTSSAPTLSAVVPSTVAKEWFTSGATPNVEIRGTGFEYGGAKIYFGSYEAEETLVGSSTSIVARMPIDDMPAGYYTIRFVNVDGQTVTLSRGLSVSENGVIPNHDYTP